LITTEAKLSDNELRGIIHLIADIKDPAQIDKLLKLPGLNVNTSDDRHYGDVVCGGPTPLQVAIKKNNEIAVEKLLAVPNIDVNYIYTEHGSLTSALDLALQEALQNRNLNILNMLFDAKRLTPASILTSMRRITACHMSDSNLKILKLFLNNFYSLEEVATLFIKKREDRLPTQGGEDHEMEIDSKSEKIIFNVTSSNIRFFQDHPRSSNNISGTIEVLVELANYLTTFGISQFDEASRTLRKVAAQAGDETSQRIFETYQINQENLPSRPRSA
jgi:hypothetical protein